MTTFLRILLVPIVLNSSQVYILPTIRINGDQYRGKLGYTEVLRALCSGFNSGQEPAACLRVAQDDCVAGSPGDLACKAKCAIATLPTLPFTYCLHILQSLYRHSHSRYLHTEICHSLCTGGDDLLTRRALHFILKRAGG